MFQCKECKGERFINKMAVSSIIRTCVDCGFSFNSLDDKGNLKVEEVVKQPDVRPPRAKPMKINDRIKHPRET
jgi:hypothetical protein